MLVITLLLLSAGVLGRVVEFRMEDAESLFEKFIVDFERNYETLEEKQMRFKNFKDNLEEINKSNQRHGHNVMGITLFADMSDEELKDYLGDATDDERDESCPHGEMDTVTVSDSFDWRQKGVVTDVKQQRCGSCWAFSAIANVESQYALKHNKLVSLSEQQEVDCDSRNDGCNGGYVTRAFLTLMSDEYGGLMAENDYPTTSSAGKCQFVKSKVVAQVTGCVDYSGANEEDIKTILVKNGPLTISLDGMAFYHYSKGVFEKCNSTGEINHALLLVGYGTDEESQKPYWLIKNSWSERWGESGYLKLVRGNPDCKVGQYRLTSSIVA